MIALRRLEACLKSLADANRLRIIHLLLHQELCGTDLHGILGLTQPNVSRHLTYLKHSGLIRGRREGFRVFYRLAGPAVRELRDLLTFLRAAFRHDPIFRKDLARLARRRRAKDTRPPEFERRRRALLKQA